MNSFEVKSKYIYSCLKKLEASVPKSYNVHFKVTGHFIKRLSERYEDDFYRGVHALVECLEKNICLVIYYLNLDCALPERGRIDFDEYTICGNVLNGEYVLTTFIKRN